MRRAAPPGPACIGMIAAGLLFIALDGLSRHGGTGARAGTDAQEARLTTSPGDPANGRRIVLDRAVSACLLCHTGPFPAPHLHGSIGPPLDGVGDRLSPGQIRLRLVDSRRVNPDTVMPAYFVTDGLTRVGAAWRGRPVLSAEQIEDVVAFLATLRTP